MSDLVAAEKRARWILACGLTCDTMPITSNAIASPSRSQSSHRTRSEMFRAKNLMFSTRSVFWSENFVSTSALVIRSTGFVLPQSLYLGSKSISWMWPVTEVTRILACWCPLKSRKKLKTGLYLDLECGLETSPWWRKSEMVLAMDGFSATLSTVQFIMNSLIQRARPASIIDGN